MGCVTSKLDDLPAVVLCRDRCTFLDEAIRHRFAFAEAHLAYLQSLKAVGLSLDRFFNQDLDGSHSSVLNLPTQRKGDPDPPETSGSLPEKIHHHLHSHSNSDSHFNFHSDDSDGSGSESLHHDHHDVSSLGHQSYGSYYPGYENHNLNLAGNGGGGGGFMNFNYMRNQTTPSVVYTQRPVRTEVMHMGESSGASSSYNPTYTENISYNSNPISYPNSYIHSGNNFNAYPNYVAGGGIFGGSSPPAPPVMMESKTEAPPPPPSPPKSSPWEFLNPFENFEKFYPVYPSSHDSREVREEEGIPDLEDEHDEFVKELHVDQKFVDSGSSSHSKPGIFEDDGKLAADDAELQYRAARPSVAMESNPVEYEVHMVDKEVVDPKESAAGLKLRRVFKDDAEAVREIQIQFERVSEPETELAKCLEVGKVQYRGKQGGHHVSSKLLHFPVMSSPSRSSGNVDPAFLDGDQELELRSKNLSSTLHKLYLWEKKLYEEVKVEEKMRVLHEQKSNKLKRLDERGAESHKIDVTRTFVRSLSAKIRIAIQVVDRISVKINNLRDDELWPQLNELIQGLTRMWKSMLECHHVQCQAIVEAKKLDAIVFRNHFSDAHFEATRQLQHDLINWTLKFTYWVSAQKGYVQALYNWLMKCLLDVPEETPDGVVPFSPSRMGAPSVFVVCNQWWRSLDMVSEKEVIDSMREFASNVLHLWDRDKTEMRQRMLVNKDERKIKSLDKEDMKIQKEIQALEKRVVLNSGDENGGRVVFQNEMSKGGSLQSNLQHVLEALEKFSGDSLKVYEELLQRIEEDHLDKERERGVS